MKFKENPRTRSRFAPPLKQRGLGESTIQRFGAESDREVIISLDQHLYAPVALSWITAQSNIADTLNLSFQPDRRMPQTSWI